MDADGANDGLSLGLDDWFISGLPLGSTLKDGKELGAELSDSTGISVGPLLGARLLDGANDGFPLGLDEGSIAGL
jgi:hypothetical protein